jgi:nicotinamidase-related amidase
MKSLPDGGLFNILPVASFYPFIWTGKITFEFTLLGEVIATETSSSGKKIWSKMESAGKKGWDMVSDLSPAEDLMFFCRSCSAVFFWLVGPRRPTVIADIP